MPRRKSGSGWIPPLRPYTGPDGRRWARVCLNGRVRHCGLWGTPEAEQKYRRLIAEWSAGFPSPDPPQRNGHVVTIDELLDAFADHAERTYRKPNGKKTGELYLFRIVAGYLHELYGNLPANEFRPRHLKAIREKLLTHRSSRRKGADRETDPKAKKLSRPHINEQIKRAVGIFRWGVESELVEPTVLLALREVKPLLRGKTPAKDNKPKPPVEWEIVQKTLPHLTRHAAALVQVIWYTGARPGEMCKLRPCDLDMSRPEWLYEPEEHKTAMYEKVKVIWFGKQAQAVLKPLLEKCGPTQIIFSTAGEPRAMRWSSHYTPDSLAGAIAKACKLAGLPHWCPKQLRSGRATEVDEAMDLEHAAAVLGDRLDTTRAHYARAKAKARKVAREMG